MQEKTIHIKFVNACLRYLYKKQDIRNLNLQQQETYIEYCTREIVLSNKRCPT